MTGVELWSFLWLFDTLQLFVLADDGIGLCYGFVEGLQINEVRVVMCVDL